MVEIGSQNISKPPDGMAGAGYDEDKLMGPASTVFVLSFVT